MFKVEMTKEHTKIQGTKREMLIGLMCYIDALKENNIPLELIKEAIEVKLKDIKKSD